MPTQFIQNPVGAQKEIKDFQVQTASARKNVEEIWVRVPDDQGTQSTSTEEPQ